MTTIVSSGQTLVLKSGKTLSGVDIERGGTIVYEGGVVKALQLENGAREVISNTTESGLVLPFGVDLIVSAGGKAVDTFVNESASISIKSGGAADHLGGKGIFIFAGGTVANLFVSSGGREIVEPGVNISGRTVSSGVTLVLSGGTDVSGTVEATGVEVVHAGAIASGVTVSSGGQIRYAGGKIEDVILQSGADVAVGSGGKLSSYSVGAGTSFTVYSGGSANAVEVQSGGTIVFAGGAVTGTISRGATEIVAAGGSLSAKAVGTDVQLVVSSGGAITATTLTPGAVLDVLTGGVAVDTVVSSGAVETLLGGSANIAYVWTGGVLNIDKGGILTSAKIYAGGTAVVNRGGVLIDRTIGSAQLVSGAKVEVTAGGEYVYAGSGVHGPDQRLKLLAGSQVEAINGAVLSGLTLSHNAPTVIAGSGGTVDQLNLSGTLMVKSGGTVGVVSVFGQTVVSSGAVVTVSSGTVLNAARVVGGELIYDGGFAGNPQVSGGTLAIASGITQSSLPVVSGAVLEVWNGATAVSARVSGGTMMVSSGGAANTTSVSSGTESVLDGGVIGGITTFGANGTLTIANAGGLSLKTSGFDFSDTLDFANFKFGKSETLTFAQHNAEHKGVVTLTDGALTVIVTLFGQYAARGFAMSNDGHGGTAITYDPNSSTPLAVAAHLPK